MTTNNSASNIEVLERSDTGKGAARKLRSQALIPAICYGGTGENQRLAVSPKDMVQKLSTRFGRNALLNLKFRDSGKEQLALVKDVHRDPVTGQLLHIDFYRVSLDKPVDVKVPVVTTGRSAGVVKGGELRIVFRSLPVRVRADKVPVEISVDVTPVDVHGHVAVKDLPVGEDVEVLLPPEQSVITVEFRKKKSMDEPAAVATEAAAPAAGTPSTAPAAKA